MRTTYFHFIDGEVGIGTTYHTLPQQGYTNEFGVGVSSHIGIGTENAKVPIQITDFSGTGLRLEGIDSDYVGMQLKTLDSSDTLSRNIFIDTVNELGNAIANQVGSVQSDGGSHWRWETQPPGDRTDRRVERLRITGLGSVGIGSDNPVTKLDVFGNIRLSDINPEIQLNFGGPRFRVPADNTLTLHNGGDSGSESHETVRISQSGNVGIGTTVPETKLDVIGNVGIEGDLLLGQKPTSTVKMNGTSGSLDVYSDAEIRFYESDNNKLMFLFDVNTSNNDARIEMEGDEDTYFNHPGDDQLGFTVGGNEVIRIRNRQVVFQPMTTAQRNAQTAQEGGVIYNSSTNKLQVYNGSAWVDLH